MASQGESLIRKTQKGLSILAFETTKQSRILKKRMRAAALQKEVKADLRDLGNLVYNALINQQPGVLEEEEVAILVESVRDNKAEVERLRDAISRLSRTRKHFDGEDLWDADDADLDLEDREERTAPEEAPRKEAESEEPLLEPEQPAAKPKLSKAAEPKTKTPAKKRAPRKESAAAEKAKAGSSPVPPAPGTDPKHPAAEGPTDDPSQTPSK